MIKRKLLLYYYLFIIIIAINLKARYYYCLEYQKRERHENKYYMIPDMKWRIVSSKLRESLYQYIYIELMYTCAR